MSDAVHDRPVVLVTGAGPGIGRACAETMLDAGWSVVVAARDADRLAAMVDELGARGEVLGVPADITDLEAAAALVERALEVFGRLDGLVNVAAAGGGQMPMREIDWEKVHAAFAINLVGTMEVCRLAADHMAERGSGSIVNISTLSAVSMPPNLTAYSASKAAMEVATKTMAKEVGRHGVRINIVSPGYTEGVKFDAMVASMAERRGITPAEMSAELASGAALRRHVAPADIAAAVAFLLSDAAAQITGHTLPVDAGALIARS